MLKTEITGIVGGTSLALAPGIANKVMDVPQDIAQAVLPIPFYESFWWMASAAILGITVLALTGINAAFNLRKNLKWDGKERRD